MEQYDMTYPQFCQHHLENNRYKEKYLANQTLWEQKKHHLLSEWKQVLLERAEAEPLRTQVIQSYIRVFGEKALWSTFRGRYEKGVSHFRIPKAFRKSTQNNIHRTV